MSQEQPRRPQEDQAPDQEPIRYGDLFNVVGDLASQPIVPQDAVAMQSAETLALGQTQRGGAASIMQSAAWLNERAGLVNQDDANVVAGDVPRVGISKLHHNGNILVTEKIAGQVVAQYVKPAEVVPTPAAIDRNAVTIGEALEAAALSKEGYKPVDPSDAAAIQAAEMRASGSNVIRAGGVAATAQSAATQNDRTMRDEDKTKLADVLSDATQKLPGDKPVTTRDAEGVIAAELRNKPDMNRPPGGIATTMAAAALINQNKTIL
ncbi:hypothetical protein SLEP1_g1076 [Rubroshorea leprosula]|uniref:SMP domain-containing protein n=1 Tax=Rubroshorea leprosula TaxID=152421 RepID=A0AAV5HLM3_9ROSI|nr:hypothetical protein SLEP1_g1076 [Rubroshorea leprosula]